MKYPTNGRGKTIPHTQRIELGANYILIERHNKDSAEIESNLHGTDTEEDRDYNSAIDGMESLLLAMAIEGVDFTTPSMLDALQSAIDGITNNT
jgi:hypothetical protein